MQPEDVLVEEEVMEGQGEGQLQPEAGFSDTTEEDEPVKKDKTKKKTARETSTESIEKERRRILESEEYNDFLRNHMLKPRIGVKETPKPGKMDLKEIHRILEEEENPVTEFPPGIKGGMSDATSMVCTYIHTYIHFILFRRVRSP